MASRAALLLASVLAVARATLPLPAFARHGASAGAPVAAAPADCCMYGGTGSGYSIGNMVFPFLGSDLPVIVTGFVAGDGESFVTMLLNSSDTESSPEGWVISGNETGQTLTFWGNAPDSCYSTFVAYPEEFLPSFKLCTGAGGLWANYLSTFRLGTISLDSFAQATQNQVAVLTAPNAGCALATLYGVGSPLGNGAWSFNAVQGEASAVPSTYGVPPSYCPAPSLRKSGA